MRDLRCTCWASAPIQLVDRLKSLDLPRFGSPRPQNAQYAQLRERPTRERKAVRRGPLQMHSVTWSTKIPL